MARNTSVIAARPEATVQQRDWPLCAVSSSRSSSCGAAREQARAESGSQVCKAQRRSGGRDEAHCVVQSGDEPGERRANQARDR